MARHDFNGDGRSDIFWQNWDGPLSSWLATPSGDFIVNPRYSYASVVDGVREIGDYNGDGFADVLLADSSSNTYVLGGRADGSFVRADLIDRKIVGWEAVGSGDFDGDNRADVLWIGGSNSRITTWLGGADFNFSLGPITGYSGLLSQGTPYLLTIADTNGDGRDNALWMHGTTRAVIDWSPTPAGEFLPQGQSVLGYAGAEWHLLGSGDFNGDGYDDLLWSHGTTGATSIWSGTATGPVVKNGALEGPGWIFGAIGDYNGDGRDDVLWLRQNGSMSQWVSDPTGEMSAASLTATVVTENAWAIMPW